VDYRNVKGSEGDLAEMLTHSRGGRRIPVIVEEGQVTIGCEGT
jgi:hypothetical protein